MNVYEKLVNIQNKLKAPKNQYNSFGKYNYRSCEDILEGLKPLLNELKAIVTLSDEMVHIEGRFYIKAIATFIDAEKGEKIEVSALAREDETKKGMDLAQVTGSVSSYARKYALNGLFCIDDTKDSDSTNTHGKADSKEKANKDTFQPSTGQPTPSNVNTHSTPQKTNTGAPGGTELHCSSCDEVITDKIYNYSKSKFGKPLCFKCQKGGK